MIVPGHGGMRHTGRGQHCGIEGEAGRGTGGALRLTKRSCFSRLRAIFEPPYYTVCVPHKRTEKLRHRRNMDRVENARIARGAR